MTLRSYRNLRLVLVNPSRKDQEDLASVCAKKPLVV